MQMDCGRSMGGPTEATPSCTHSPQPLPGADAKRHEDLEMCFEMNMKNGGREQERKARGVKRNS